MDDLTPAVERAALTRHWSSSHAQLVQREYLRFVELVESNPGLPLVPAEDVDAVWHENLRIASEGVALAPVAPAHRANAGPHLRSLYETTLSLYRQRFGEPPPVWALHDDCHVDEPALGASGPSTCHVDSPPPLCD